MRNAAVATCSLILVMVIIAGVVWNVINGYIDRLEDKQHEQMEQIEAYTPANLDFSGFEVENMDILEVLAW